LRNKNGNEKHDEKYWYVLLPPPE